MVHHLLMIIYHNKCDDRSRVRCAWSSSLPWNSCPAPRRTAVGCIRFAIEVVRTYHALISDLIEVIDSKGYDGNVYDMFLLKDSWVKDRYCTDFANTLTWLVLIRSLVVAMSCPAQSSSCGRWSMMIKNGCFCCSSKQHADCHDDVYKDMVASRGSIR